MAELIKENAGVEMHPSMPVEEARKIADGVGVEWLDVWGSGKIMSEVYDESSEQQLIEPTFVMDHPREVSPLARAHRDDPTLTERFELVVAGARARQRLQRAQRPGRPGRSASSPRRELQAGGDEEAEPVDDDYVEALEYGLPPTGGLGIGLDRLVMLISGAEAIRDVILFPTLRPEGRRRRRRVGGGRLERRTDGRRLRRPAPDARRRAAPAAHRPRGTIGRVRRRRPDQAPPLAAAAGLAERDRRAAARCCRRRRAIRFSLGHFSFIAARRALGGADRLGRDRARADRGRPRAQPRQAPGLGDRDRCCSPPPRSST